MPQSQEMNQPYYDTGPQLLEGFLECGCSI